MHILCPKALLLYLIWLVWYERSQNCLLYHCPKFVHIAFWRATPSPKQNLFRKRAWVGQENRSKITAQVLFLCKAELGFFHFLEIVTSWLVPSASQKIPVKPTFPSWRSPLRKTGFFRQVRQLKIQRKVQAVLYELWMLWSNALDFFSNI